MYRDNRYNQRDVKRRSDYVLAENNNEATHWLSLEHHQRANFRVVPAQKSTKTHTGAAIGATFDDYPTLSSSPISVSEDYIEQLDLATNGADADVEVQFKEAGWPDEAALTIERHTMTGTVGDYRDLASDTPRSGFIRLIATRVGSPVSLSLEVVPAPEVS